MLKFMVVFPNANEIVFFQRKSYSAAFRDCKRWLQIESDPDLSGETRAYLFIANAEGTFSYVKTIYIQMPSDQVLEKEIQKYSAIAVAGNIGGKVMLKITVNGDKGTFDFEGSNFEMAMDAGTIMYVLVKYLRKSGRSDAFIRGLFDVVMKQKARE